MKWQIRFSKKRKTKLKLFDRLPDELIHLILEYCLSVDYDMFSHRNPTQLLVHRAEVEALSFVCSRWRRIILPIYYETVIITSKEEANDLAFELRQRHQRIGHYIKKLRIERGQGRAIYTILSKVPRLTTLCITLDGIFSQNANSLCRGLKLVNPQHLILRDYEVWGNRGVRNVVDVLIECMTSIWSNLVLYDHPYDEIEWLNDLDCSLQCRERHKRAQAVSKALALIPNLRTVYVPRAYYVENENDVVFNAIKNPSLRKMYSRIYWSSRCSASFEAVLKAHPWLREVVHLPLPGPWTYPVYAAVGDRSLSEIQKRFTFFTYNSRSSPAYLLFSEARPEEW